jgi:hypothetical protein
MSVISKVLRDLDARGVALALHGAARGGEAGAPAASVAPRHPTRAAARRLTLIVALGAVAIGAAAFGDITPLIGPAVEPATRVAVAVGSDANRPAAAALLPDTTSAQDGAPAAAAQDSAAPPPTPVAPAALPTPVQSVAPPTPVVPVAPRTSVAPAAPPTPVAAVAPPTLAAPAAPAQPLAKPASRAVNPSATAMAAALPSSAPVLGPAPAPALAQASAPAPDRASVPPTPPRIDKRLHAADPAQRLARLYRQAVDAAQAGQRLAAIATARELLALDPRHEAARHLAAHLEAEAGATDRAVALLREGLAHEPSSRTLALALARVLAAAGLADEALAVLDAHAVPGPEAAGLRAGVLARRGDYAAALPAYETAARAQPLEPMWWLGLGVALESLGEPARARQAFAKAHAIGLAREDLADYVEQRLRALE